MNAIEEIQAAVDKLTALNNESTPGKWAKSAAELDEPGFMLSPRTCGGCGGDWPLEETDTDLIVTLHRTIDAQLVILTRSCNLQIMGREQISDAVLALARAINGGTA